MPFYKHYSFDLWLTLIKSNPAFKTERARYFYTNFNSVKKSFEEVCVVFRQVDLMVNSINEKTGKNIDAEEMYLMVISIINNYSTEFQDIAIDELYNEMELLVLKYMPQVYCADSTNVLYRLKESGLSTTSLLSNTGFIKGKTLRRVLQELRLDELLDFQLYSDEVRLSKPNQQFFQLMLDTIDKKKHPELNLTEVIHIGDNPLADVRGAEKAGIRSLQINSNHLSIGHLLL
ncbi:MULTISPECIES: HAD family hydrolase [Pedobacter]|uniref:Haloacid dehalogenase domain protein hydrolase n=1 Tax=Pedobacter heparinus (strain ATCC 13125 / DSM 2366 / CIP 104194 / JCM 7457 / NBRC 12017 / NCIMB 9290 / NRRL B-14731 / HIM 762-3) TaxID=485917 RepID=C6XW66_PEDHD|nr:MULTISPECIES: HAD family hydrolase [Pedobacter]ACU04145.1 Haloacid dehalogenase domain protein hydrolase [Pedobacter heparinus DSM 2366]MBB5436403.1 putative hydrolase of the HAD superfamily [Pedobacter sp. AK017]